MDTPGLDETIGESTKKDCLPAAWGQSANKPAAIIVTGTAMAWYAIFNGLGRILWGMIPDRIGRKAAIVAMSALQGLIMLAMYHGFISFGLALGLIFGASLIGFNYGGIFALFPAITADYFGDRQVGRNYGWVFTA